MDEQIKQMNIEAYILIGGRSSRLGRDKASVKFDGVSLAERTANTIERAISPSRTTLVAANEFQLLSLAGIELSLPFVFDLYEGRGPWAGLHAALANARSEWILVLACDLPLISVELLSLLSEMVADDLDAVVPVQPDGKVQPLCALYRVKSFLEIVERPLLTERPTPPLRAVFEEVRTRLVEFDEYKDLPGSDHFFLNMNSPADLQRATEIIENGQNAR